MRYLQLVVIPLISLSLAGCSILFGNIRPVVEKAGHYEVFDPTLENDEWVAMPNDNPAGADSSDDTGQSDLAFQSKANGSIMSLNTACRPSLNWDAQVSAENRESENQRQLKIFTQQLLMGIRPSEKPGEKFISVSDQPALETTLSGTLAGSPTRVRTVVVRKGDCIYDLMYVSKPQVFDANEPLFSRFVASLKMHR